MIEAKGLTKVFKGQKRAGLFMREGFEVTAVNGLDLDVPEGAIVGLLGLNGAGKTTTIKMVATLLEPTSGWARVDGLDVVARGPEVRRLVNMVVGGERMLYWRLTARENLWYFAQLYGVPTRLVKPRIEELLGLVGLSDAADVPVERYSKGMKQRLQFARGLINDPRYVFLDEPTLGLDAPIARELRAFTKRLSAEMGKGVLLTSHYMAEVEELCQEITVIHKGARVAQGTPQEIKRRTGQRYTLNLTVAGSIEQVGPVLRQLEAQGIRVALGEGHEGIEFSIGSQSDVTGEVVAAVIGSGARLLRLNTAEPSLEDAIISLTAG